MLMFELDGIDFKEKFGEAIGDCLIYPCSWMKVFNEDKTIGKREDGSNIVESNVNTERLDYYDVWVDFSWRRKLTDVFHRIESNVNKIQANINKQIYQDKMQEVIDSSYDIDVDDKKAEVQALFLSMPTEGVDKKEEAKAAKKLGKAEILEWWGSYDVDDSGFDTPILVTIANRTVGLRIDVYEDGIPFFPVRIGKNTRTVYGRPFAQQLEMLQEELNEKRSKRLDLLDRSLKLMFKARRHSMLDWDNLFSAPDNVILMDDIEHDLGVIPSPQMPITAYKEEEITKQDMGFTTGIEDLNKLAQKGTATGVSAVLSETASRRVGRRITSTGWGSSCRSC